MRISSQLLLTFLLNACWQIALIAALAGCGSMLLRNSVARYRHWLWVSALCLAFLVPAITSSRVLLDDAFSRFPLLRSGRPAGPFHNSQPNSRWKYLLLVLRRPQPFS